MDWTNERYVRIYTRDTADWVCLSWEARALFLLMLRKADRSGVIAAKRKERALAALLEMPLEVIERAVAELIEDGCVTRREDGFVIPNYLEAQEANQSSAQRQRESRARHRASADNGSPKQPVTPSHKASRRVTRSHAQSQDVTPSLAVPSLAVPSLTKPLTTTTTTTTSPSQKPDGAGKVTKKLECWPAEAAVFWLEHVGAASPGRCGKVLKPLVDRHGWPATRAGAELWIDATKHKGGRLKLEYFAAEAASYIDLAQLPLVDETGVLTAHGRLASGGTLS